MNAAMFSIEAQESLTTLSARTQSKCIQSQWFRVGLLKGRAMKTTITDVAKQAGVSMKTVSRVLNNEPNVAKITRERVMQAASELNYTPNLAARGLASSRSYLIALLYDNPSPSYLSNLQHGAVEACRRNGYHLVLEPIPMEDVQSPDLEARLRRLSVDGVIIAPPLSDSDILLSVLSKLGLRHSVVSPEVVGEAPTVLMDDSEAAFMMGQHLIELGHKDIAFVKGPASHSSSVQRLSGFTSAMREAGLPLRDDWMCAGDFTVQSGVEAAKRLLADPDNRPTAIFASNDDMAAGVMTYAARLGISIPGDLSVCGFDDTPIAEIVWPKLTTIAQPIHEMGKQAVKLLVDRTSADKSRYKMLKFELLKRGSTGPAKPS